MTRLLVVAAALVVVLAAAGVGAGAEWDVYPGGSIQDAIDGAGAGDTIYVHAGTYVENVDVDKRVTLIGEGAEVVTVRAKDRGDHVFEVTADYVNISGFTVNGATRGWVTAGIYFGTDHCTISDNIASNNHKGISLWDSSNNNLTNNNVSNNHYGIYLYGSSSNTLTGNTISGNTYNFDVSGSSLSEYTQNIDTSNTVDGKPIYYWVDQKDRQIPSDAGFVGVVNGTNITVRDLTLTNNSHGVLFAYTENSRIENVTASNNDKGICIDSSSGNTLTGNNASSNSDYGIRLQGSSNNTLTSNNASNNEYGIGIDFVHSSGNTLRENTMSGNVYNFGVNAHPIDTRLLGYIQNIDTSNTVDGKPIYYLVDQNDRQIPSDAGFVGVVNCTNITVRDLTLTNNRHGVLFAYTENSRIVNVTASNNDEGICLDSSSNNTLTGNNASSNSGNGICIGSSSNNTLIGNNASSNRCGIHLYCSHPSPSSNNTLTNNTAPNNYYGIWLSSSSNNTLTDNTASHSYHGIWLCYSSNYNTLTGNTASNSDYGIYIEESCNNTLTDNTASDDELGIYLRSSSGNTIYHNNLAGNTDYNAYDTGTNQWDAGSVGNYYSDYTGTDNNTDGIGDDPYPIPGGGDSVDSYPLMQPWTGGTQQLGDLNHDHKITPADAAIALRIAVSGAHDDAADVNGDGRSTSLDALMILQAAAGRIEL